MYIRSSLNMLNTYEGVTDFVYTQREEKGKFFLQKKNYEVQKQIKRQYIYDQIRLTQECKTGLTFKNK